jgi:hypothetical protein
MRKVKIVAALAICVALSSCGIFKKSCNCPHFGKSQIVKSAVINLC